MQADTKANIVKKIPILINLFSFALFFSKVKNFINKANLVSFTNLI